MRHGSSSQALVSSGATIVTSGQVLSGAFISASVPTLVEVQSGGIVENSTFSGSVTEILEGGSDSGSLIGAGASQYVFSGGIATGDSIAGSATVFSGGVSVSAQILSGGSTEVGFDASMQGASILSGGSAVIDGGGVASATLVQGGGALTVGAGGSAFGGSIASGGLLIDGGIDSGTVVSSGGLVLVSGGVADGDTLLSGAVMVVIGGSVSGTIDDGGAIVSTGELLFTSGGGISYVGSGLTNLSGGFTEVLVLDRGSIDSSTVSSGSLVEVTSGGSASFDVISGTIDVLSGGVASGLTVTQLGVENVESGGIDSGSTLSFAFQNVLSGGLAVGVGIFAATQDVRGGETISSYISASGEELVELGGVASATVVAANGYLILETGGSAVDARLFGSALLMSGGTLDDATIGRGGEAFVSAGGIVQGGTVTSDGLVIASSGGAVSDLTLSSGGYVVALAGSVLSGIVSDGGEVISTGVVIHENDGHLVVGNTISFADLGSGTALVLDSGTLISASDGIVTVLSGGTVRDTSVTGAASGPGTGVLEVIISSGGSGIDINAENRGGRIFDYGGTLTSGSVTSAAFAYILSGGVANAMSASSGALIDNQSITHGDHVFASGGEEAYEGGISEGTVVSGAYASMLALEGTIASAHVGGAGYITISTGGYSTASVIASGGLEIVKGGGVSLDDTVSGGFIIDNLDGTVSGVTIGSGGIVFAASGGVVDGADVASGGILVVAPGASTSGITTTGGLVVSTGVAELNGSNQGSYDAHGLSGVYVSAADVFVLAGGVVSGITGVGSTVQFSNFTATPGRGTAILVESGGLAIDTTIGGSGQLYESAQEIFSGGVASGTIVQIDGEEIVYAGGVSNDVKDDGSETVLGSVSGVTVLSGAALLVSAGGHVAGAHVMSTGYLELSGASAGEYEQDTGAVTLDVGANLSFLGIQSGAADTATWDAATGQLEVSAGGLSIEIDLVGNYANDYFVVSGSSEYVTVTVEQGTPCYCPGTLILTSKGEVPIEALRIGDHLVTRNGTSRPLKWIGRRSYDGRFITARTDILPVTFAPGSLGRDSAGQPVPRRPLTVSPLHAMFLDGVLVPASALVDGRAIVQAACVDQVDYIHLELDTHDVIVAEGALSESFVDDGSRGMFQNAGEYAQLYPGAPSRPALFCAPRIEDGDGLEAIRARLAA